MSSISSRFRFLLAGAILVLGTKGLRADDAVKMTVLRLPSGLRFGLIGERPTHPAPTLFVLQGSLDLALKEPIYTEIGRIMTRHGFIGIMVEAPAHGEDHRPGEPANELAAWCTRLEHGEDFISDFTTKARAVLDYLVKENYTDPTRVAAVGTSRGGFLAFHLAAVEPRIRCIGGIAALSDLTELREFKNTDHRTQAEALALSTLVPRLVGRPAWIGIGNNDARVGTDQVIAFSRLLVKASVTTQKGDGGVPVEVIINSSAGHHSRVEDHELLATWLLKQFAVTP